MSVDLNGLESTISQKTEVFWFPFDNVAYIYSQKKHPLLGNSAVTRDLFSMRYTTKGMHAAKEELLEAVFSVWSSPRPHEGKPRVVRGDEKRSLRQ
jgi:hypothetical protein